MSHTLLRTAENSRIIITTSNNNNTVNNNNNTVNNNINNISKWPPKIPNGYPTWIVDNLSVDHHLSSSSTPEMPASSSSQQQMLPSSSSSPPSSSSSSPPPSSSSPSVTSSSPSVPTSSNVKAPSTFSSASKSDVQKMESVANGRLPLRSVSKMARSSSSSSSSSPQILDAISTECPRLPSSSSTQVSPTKSTLPCDLESESSNADDGTTHRTPSSSSSPKASSSTPEAMPVAPSVSQASSSSSSSPQTSKVEDVSRKLPTSASLSSCLTNYLSIKSSPSFSPYDTAPSSGIPSPSPGRPESPRTDSSILGISEISESREVLPEESKHSNLPEDTSVSPVQSKEVFYEPMPTKQIAEGGPCCKSCSEEDDKEKRGFDGSKVVSVGHPDSPSVAGPAEGARGRSDSPDRSKRFGRDTLLALSMGQFARTPFSTTVSLSASPQQSARQLASPVVSSATKTTTNSHPHSSPFGGFLAKLKDALPGRGSTSDLSRSSRLEKSTTALILQERQPGLPSKAADEELRHRLMYDNIIEEVKKKEKREARKNMERVKNQLKMEDLMSSALKVWKRDLLPYWDDVRNNYNTRQLWWHGIPPSIRGLVWKLVIGNDLNITKELYEICLQRFQELLKTATASSSSSSSSSSSTSASPSLTKMAAKTMSPSSSTSSLPTKQVANGPSLLSTNYGKEQDPVSRESSVELIRLDVSRTFPSLCIFQKVGPYHEYLEGLLGAYVCYRPDVGYVQGMSFVAAILLLNMEAHDAFICFANLLNRPIFIAFFRLDADMMRVYFSAYNFCFKSNLPKLYKHFLEQKLSADLYIIDWVFSLYSKCFNLDIVSRIWDVFFRDGEQFLFRTALGILKLFQPILMDMDFIQMAQFLVRPPESQVDPAELFHSIESIDMECKGLTFRQVLEQFKVSQLTSQH